MRNHLSSVVVVTLFVVVMAASANAQGKKERLPDPATPSPKVSDAMKKIRGVAQYDKLLKELQRIKKENQRLTEAINKLNGLAVELQKVKAANNLLKTENKKLQAKLSLQKTKALPIISIKSRAISKEKALLVLSVGKKTVRVRNDSTVIIPLAGGEPTMMKVAKITADSVVLEFPDLKRQLVLHP